MSNPGSFNNGNNGNIDNQMLHKQKKLLDFQNETKYRIHMGKFISVNTRWRMLKHVKIERTSP